MKYMLIMNEVESGYAARTDPSLSGAYWAGWAAYTESVKNAGIFVSGAGLEPPDTATTIRVRGSQTQVQDGPYADTKEQLAGFFVIDVPDLDNAMQWAAKAPAASIASVEIRPVIQPRHGQ